MHPLITRARPAQARARHILDTALGALDITAPEVADHSARDQLELACRAEARSLLDDEMRQHLADLEAAQRSETLTEVAATAIALAVLAPEVADHSAGKRRTPDATQRLHTLLTLADLAQAAPIRPAEPPSELAQRDATLGNHTP